MAKFIVRNKVATAYLLGVLATLIGLLYMGLVELEHNALDADD